jgi:hypothetical protein
VLPVIFRIGRAAVKATEIAAIRHRNSQVGDLSAELVVQAHLSENTLSQKRKSPIR